MFLAGVAMMGWGVISALRLKPRRVLILGSGPMASKVIRAIESSRSHWYVVAGVVNDEGPTEASTSGALWLGPCDQLVTIVRHVQPARIVIAIADRRDHLPVQALLESRVRGVVVDDALDFWEHLTGQMAIEAIRPSMLILGAGFRNHGAADAIARGVSVVGAAIGLLLALPLLIVSAIAIVLDSPGPVLFVTARAGRNGRPFGLLKLRTMHPSDQHRSEWVMDNTDRITRVGKWLRRFRIDELPQFVNVLKGDMNLIGPRPHPTSNHAIFMEHIAYYSLRSTVHPGVTGWAQVRYGYANNLAEETEKMRYDLYYIKNRTLWLDLRIVVATVACILTGRGSAAVQTAAEADAAARPARDRARGLTPLRWLDGRASASVKVARP